MVTKVLNIEVRDGEIDELNKDLKKVKRNMDDVEGSTNKTAKGLEKVRDNGGAIATLDTFTGGLATKIRDAAEATKVFNFNLKATKTALIATGIGAFVVALGLIVAYWDDIKSVVTGVNVALEKQIELKKELVDQADKELKLLDASDNILKQQGKTEQEIINLKKERLKEVIRIAEEELALQKQQLEYALNSESTIKGQSERFLKFFGKVAFRIAEMLDKATGGIFNFSKAAGAAVVTGDSLIQDLFGNEDEIKELESNIDDLTLKITQARDRLAGIELNNISRGEDQEELKLPTTGLTITQLEELGRQEFDALALQQAARTRLEEANSAVRREIAEREAQAKVESYMLAADGFATASRLIGQETAEGKTFSVAATLISTYLSAQKAYQSQIAIPTPDAPARAAAAAAISVASGLANVKEILRVKIPGYEGSYGSVGAGASIPPAFNVVGTSPQNQLNQALLEQNKEPLEAFVVEGKVSTAEQLRRGKINASSIG